MDDRAAILGAVRRGLRRGPLNLEQREILLARLKHHPRQLVPARGQGDAQSRIALFMHYVEREFGTAERLSSLADVPGAIATYLAAQNLAPALVVSPHPMLAAVDFSATPLLQARYGLAGPGDAVCFTQAFAGIAETGTLMLPSGPERPTANNLLADYALVLLPAARIVAAYEDAFDLLRAEQPNMPRNVMLVTGPSRSADIEQTLELGAHGPRQLHVLIVDGAE